MTEPGAALTLSCFAGRPAPAWIAGDFEALAALPHGAQDRLWDVLGPCLDPAPPSDLDRLVDAFARKHEAVLTRLVSALRGARALVAEAAASGADEATFAADLGRLAGGDAATAERLRAVLLPGYAKAIAAIRTEIIRRTLLEHGNLLTRVDWRVDQILGSQHGRDLRATLGVVTLTFKRGAAEERVTLHCEPGLLRRLRAACDEMLS
jgi:hypothetical protein